MLELFAELDVDHTGDSDENELKIGLRKKGIYINEVILESMLRVAYTNSDGKISREEFISWSVNPAFSVILIFTRKEINNYITSLTYARVDL